jgi:hypothetical protein
MRKESRVVYSQFTNAHAAPTPHLTLPPLRPGPVLFLDFDGVLHRPPLETGHGLPALDPRFRDHRLFECLHLLEPVVDAFKVQVVLSTSWVSSISTWRSHTDDEFESPHPWARTLLPMLGRVGNRVVGATLEPEFVTSSEWERMTRYQQIDAFARRHGIHQWLALDDNARGWPPDRWFNIVAVNPDTALTLRDAGALYDRLRQLCASSYPPR